MSPSKCGIILKTNLITIYIYIYIYNQTLEILYIMSKFVFKEYLTPDVMQ